MMEYTVFDILPIPKPRMTRRDKWKKRECVIRYHEFKDAVADFKIKLPDHGYHVIFIIPFPKSWSKKKKARMRHQAHQQRPDKDNVEKALLDSIFKEDSHIWDGRCSKIWGNSGKIILITGIDSDWIKPFLDDIL